MMEASRLPAPPEEPMAPALGAALVEARAFVTGLRKLHEKLTDCGIEKRKVWRTKKEG